MLKECYPVGSVSPWLSEPVPSHIGQITWSVMFMAEALEVAPTGFDFVHLSKILDLLSPEKAQGTLELAWRALRPGG